MVQVMSMSDRKRALLCAILQMTARGPEVIQDIQVLMTLC